MSSSGISGSYGSSLYIYTVEYYTAINRNEIESVEVMWINLEPVTQSEVSQKDKNKYHSSYIYGI